MRTLDKELDPRPSSCALAVTAPRFDEEPFERVRAHMNARLRHDAKDPGALASRTGGEGAFPAIPTASRAEGELETLARIERDDLVEAAKRGATRAINLQDRGRRRNRRGEARRSSSTSLRRLPAKDELKP